MAEMGDKPWWAPDLRGFIAGCVMLMCGYSLFIRSNYPNTIDDKILDVLTGALWVTGFGIILNYSFGSSSGSTAKDENQSKVVEKLTTAALAPAATSAAAVTAAAEAAAPAAAVKVATDAAKAAAPPAADIAAPPAAEKAVAEALAKSSAPTP